MARVFFYSKNEDFCVRLKRSSLQLCSQRDGKNQSRLGLSKHVECSETKAAGFVVQMLQTTKKEKPHKKYSFSFGAPRGTRTPDLLVRSQTLYPAELLAHLFLPKYTITKTLACQVLFLKKSVLGSKIQKIAKRLYRILNIRVKLMLRFISMLLKGRNRTAAVENIFINR